MASKTEEEIRQALEQVLKLYDIKLEEAPQAELQDQKKDDYSDIIGKTVTRMADEFGCRPADLRAVIGPSLGPCCAEFVNYEAEIPRSLWPFRVGPYHFDFWKISRHQLVRSGLAANSVSGELSCTMNSARCPTPRTTTVIRATVSLGCLKSQVIGSRWVRRERGLWCAGAPPPEAAAYTRMGLIHTGQRGAPEMGRTRRPEA